MNLLDLSNLFNKLTVNSVKKLGLYSLIIWIIYPIIVFFLGFLFKLNISFKLLLPLYLFGFLGILNFIIYLYKTKFKFNREHIIKYLPVLLLLIYLLWAILSTFFSNNKEVSIFGSNNRAEGLLTYIWYFGFFCNSFIVSKEECINKILKIFIFVVTFLSIMTLINHYMSFINFNFFRDFTSIFSNENHYAYYLNMGVIANVLLLLLIINDKKKFILYIFCYCINLYTLILNNTLGCYLSVLLTLIIIFVYCVIMKNNLKKFLLLFILFLGISLVNYKIVFTNLGGIFSDASKIQKNLLNNSNIEEIYDAGTNRIGLWVKGVEFISEKPFFGYGIDNLLQRYSKFNDGEITDRPHNEYIQIAAFMGLPALIFYLLFLISVFLKVMLNFKRVPVQFILTSIISNSYLISAFFGVSMFYTTPYLFIFLGLTASYSFNYNHK